MLNAICIVYLALALLRPQEFLPFLQAVPLMKGMLYASFVLWLFSKNKAIHLPQFPFLAWFLVAGALSVGLAGWWGGALVRLAVLLPVVMLCLMLVAGTQSIVMLRRILVVMIACASLMVLHGRGQLADGVGWTGLPPTQGRITYAGIFSDPNDLGQLLGVCLAACVYFYRSSKRMLRMTVVPVAGWLCYGIYLTASRGTMLAALVVLAIEVHRRLGKVFLAVVGVIAVPVLAAATRLGDISAQEQSAAGRVDSWYQGMQMFFAHPLFGVGLGNFTEYHPLTAHNSFIRPLAELGVAGFVPWLGIMWVTARMLHWLAHAPHTPRRPEVTTEELAAEREAGLGLFSMAVSLAITSFFLSQSYEHVPFILVGLVMARFAHAAGIFCEVPSYAAISELPRIVAAAGCVIVGMWTLTRVLL